MKLKVLKDEAVTKVEKINTPKEKKMKCGQCEKGLAFTVNRTFVLSKQHLCHYRFSEFKLSDYKIPNSQLKIHLLFQ